MSVWAAFGAQLPKSYENARRTRLDTLNAFNTFKKNNPYATGAEFQQFIDTASGGSNYLRGGLPGQEIIDAIDKENAGNRDRRAAEQYMTQMDQMFKLDGQVSGQIDQALLGMKPDATEADYNAAFNTFINTLPEGGLRDEYSNRAQPKFNQGNRNQLVTAQIRDNLPDALNFMKSSAGSDVTAADLGQYFGLPSDVADGLFARTNELYGQEQDELKQSQYDSIVSAGLREIKASPELDTDALTARLKGLYPGIKDQFAGDFFQKVATDALERKRIETDNRNRTIRNEAGVVGRSIRSAAQQNPVTQQAILQGDQAGWTQDLLDQFKEEFSDEQFELYFGTEKSATDKSYFDSDWNKLVEIARSSQRQDQQSKRTAASTSALTAAMEYRETNNTRADKAFAFSKDHGEGVETILSGMFDMNPSFANAAAEATNQILLAAGDNAGEITPSQIVEKLLQTPEVMGLTIPIAQAATNHGNQMLQINGAFDVMDAEDYFTGFQEEYTGKFNEFENYVTSIMSSETLNLDQKRTLLAQAQLEANKFATSSMNNHIQRQRRQDNWVTRGTGGYNVDRHDALGSEIEGMSVSLGGVIGQAQTTVLRQIEEQANNPEVNLATSQVATPLFNTTLESILSDAGDFDGAEGPVNAMEAMTKLKYQLRKETVHARNGKTLGGHQDTRDQLTMITKYLDEVLMGGGLMDGPKITVQARLASNTDEFKQFIADPISHILSDEDFLNKYPGFRQAIDE